MQCFDCQGHIWLDYIDEAIAWASEVACFESRLHALTRPGQKQVDFFSNIDEEAQAPGFLLYGPRKRVIMREFLQWAEQNPAPKLANIRVGLEAGPGPGNAEGGNHPFCAFHHCSDEYCNGVH